MKKLFVLITLCMAFASCDVQEQTNGQSFYDHIDHSYDKKLPVGYKVIVLDSCEYIHRGNDLVHKGNCKYCEERRKTNQ